MIKEPKNIAHAVYKTDEDIQKMNVPSKTTNLKMISNTIGVPIKTVETIYLAPTAAFNVPKLSNEVIGIFYN